MKKKISKTDSIYMAGLFDGEGTVGIYQHGKATARRRVPQFMLIIQLAGTHEPTMRWIYETFGGSLLTEKGAKARNSKWSKAWRWKTNSRQARVFLESVFPYLKVKRNQVRIALRFQRHVEAYNWRRYRKQHSGGLKPLPSRVLVYRRKLADLLIETRRAEKQSWTVAA